MTTLPARIAAPGPKKILACDGGGIRGLIAVEILARLESELRAARGAPDLVLADFFDFACGTSTGAVIAACVSAGMEMAAVRRFYVDSGAQMFDRASILKRLHYKYNDEPLARTLQRELNKALGRAEDGPPALLGDPGLRTVLMMVLRNHSTDSPWPVSNNPHARYNQRQRADGTPREDCNLDLPLWQLVRASTAAPTFFPPEVVTFAAGTQREYDYVFTDGGVTTYNNPAFLAFQMATAAPYHLNWATGVERMLIVSVGTGGAAMARPDQKAGDLWLLEHASSVPNALMNAATSGWDMACRLLGECRHGEQLDREAGSMVAAPGTATWTGPKLFSYVRYQPDLSRQGLDALGLGEVEPGQVQQLDSIEHIGALQRVGQGYAEAHLRLADLRPFV